MWTKDLKINTVHVQDVARAIWAVSADSKHGGLRKSPITNTEIYNLCDDNDTGTFLCFYIMLPNKNPNLIFWYVDQGSINTHLQSIFGIETGFQGTIISQFAKLNLDSVTEDVNDEHLEPWSALCKEGGVSNTPLTPYLDKELLKDNALSVDGEKVSFLKLMMLACVCIVLANKYLNRSEKN